MLQGCGYNVKFNNNSEYGGLLVSTKINSKCEKKLLGNTSYIEFDKIENYYSLNFFMPRILITNPLLSYQKKPYGYINFLLLDQGEYFLKGVESVHFGRIVSSRKDIDLAFNIERGKITYIGEINFDYCSQKDFFTITNMRDEDLVLAKKKYPNVDFSNLVFTHLHEVK
ncbi:hypothetical protein B9G39_20635 [Zooshikella ganghwensis]|uniref:Uncharacterized protein n=2 Tax=Zooshikella ganghwensis TaxID=202772 RepID=A0A4P9VTB1_9GAMM|nr:hypothetical protein B9G39_20635 [Zooshikella ganghwensis]